MTSLEQRLRDAGDARRDAEFRRIATAADLHNLIRKAHQAQWAKVRIAEVAGISRQTVHEILRDT